MRKLFSGVLNIVGGGISKLYSIFVIYKNKKIKMKTGAIIQYPYYIYGEGNIKCGESVNIGIGSVIMSTRAKFIIKGHFVSGPGLTVVTGGHMPVIGKYFDTVTDTDKDTSDVEHNYDKDVVIEEDVWAGANVTILKGVTIGRGCIIASGAVVTKNMPPYSIVGGVPARAIKQRWSNDQIQEHEKILYSENKRISIAERSI